jgi:hypothetical protein
MTEISIRDLTAEGSLAYYTIKVDDWIYDGYATTLEGAFHDDIPQSQVRLS